MCFLNSSILHALGARDTLFLCAWTHAHKCNRIISLLHLLSGIPRLPQTMVDAFVMQESCSLFPLLLAFNPSVPSVSLALSNRVSPAEYGCIFPSRWKKHKIKPIKSFCDKGFTPASQWLCLSASVLFVSVFCSTAEILCNSPCLACEWLVYIFPETHLCLTHTPFTNNRLTSCCPFSH